MARACVLSRTRVCPAPASPARTHACEVHTHTPTPTQVSLSVSPSAWVHVHHHRPAGTLLLSLQVGQFVSVCVRASCWLGPPVLRWTVTRYLPGSDLPRRGEEAAPVTTGTDETPKRRTKRQIWRGSTRQLLRDSRLRNQKLRRNERRSCTQQSKKREKRRQTGEILFSFAPTRPPRERKKRKGIVMLGV